MTRPAPLPQLTQAEIERTPEFALLDETVQRHVSDYVKEGAPDHVANEIACSAEKHKERDRLMHWALRIDPAAAVAVRYFVEPLIEGGQAAAARALLERARTSPTSEDDDYTLWDAQILAAEGQLAKAARLCARELRKVPTDKDYLALRASIRTRQGKPVPPPEPELDSSEMLEMVSTGKVMEMLSATPALARAFSDDYQLLSLLHYAVEQGKHDVVKRLIALGANVNRRSGHVSAWEDAYAPLHLAVEKGDRTSVRLLLAAGAKPDVRSEDSQCPLHLAASKGDLPVVRLLLAAGADPNVRTRHPDQFHMTPLMLAAAYGGNASVVRALIAAGADRDARAGSTSAADLARMNENPRLARVIENYKRPKPLARSTGRVGRGKPRRR